MAGLDQATIDALLATEKKQKAAKAAKSPRAKKDPTAIRTFENWWKLPTEFGRCDNPNCIDPRVEKVAEGSQMVTKLKKGDELVNCCRRCFLGPDVMIDGKGTPGLGWLMQVDEE